MSMVVTRRMWGDREGGVRRQLTDVTEDKEQDQEREQPSRDRHEEIAVNHRG
jgi:hypothetical protein